MSTQTKNQDYEAKDVDSTLVDPFDPERFTDIVQTSVRANIVMEDVAMTVNRELVGSAGSSIKVRQVGATTVNEKTEGSATAETDFSHTAVEISTDPSNANGYVLQSNIPFTDEAREDSNLPEMDRAAEEAGEDHAEYRDQEHYNLVEGQTAGGADPADGEAHSAVVSSDGEISYSDVKDLAQTMRQNDYSVDALVISHDHLADLLDEDKFILANEADTDAGLRDGLVGRFAGVEVYVTSQANGSTTGNNDTQAVLMDSERAYAVAVKRDPTAEEDRDEQAGVTNMVITQRFGHETVDENAIGLLQNSGA
jgi:N4-gp56 family major capsid protein